MRVSGIFGALLIVSVLTAGLARATEPPRPDGRIKIFLKKTAEGRRRGERPEKTLDELQQRFAGKVELLPESNGPSSLFRDSFVIAVDPSVIDEVSSALGSLSGFDLQRVDELIAAWMPKLEGVEKLTPDKLAANLNAMSSGRLERRVAAAGWILELANRATPDEIRALSAALRQEAVRAVAQVYQEVSSIFSHLYSGQIRQLEGEFRMQNRMLVDPDGPTPVPDDWEKIARQAHQAIQEEAYRKDITPVKNILSGLISLIDRLDAPSSIAYVLMMAQSGEYAGIPLMTRNEWRQKRYFEGWLKLQQKSVDDTLTYLRIRPQPEDRSWLATSGSGGLYDYLFGSRTSIIARRYPDEVSPFNVHEMPSTPLIFLAGPRSKARTGFIESVIAFVLANEGKITEMDKHNRERYRAEEREKLRSFLGHIEHKMTPEEAEKSIESSVEQRMHTYDAVHAISGQRALDHLIWEITNAHQFYWAPGVDQRQFHAGILDIVNGLHKRVKTPEMRLWLLDRSLFLIESLKEERTQWKERKDLTARLELLETYVRIAKEELLDEEGRIKESCASRLDAQGEKK